jgi:hypothetical protein
MNMKGLNFTKQPMDTAAFCCSVALYCSAPYTTTLYVMVDTPTLTSLG